MANTFNNAKASGIGLTSTTIYTVPTGTTSVVHALYLSNVTTSTIKVTVKIDSVHVLKDVEILANSTLLMNKPLNMLAGESLIVSSDTDLSLDVVASILEVS